MPNDEGYDLWSKTYDTYANPTVAMDELAFSPTLCSIHGKDVLEIGCGTGRHTVKLAHARRGNRVTAIDASAGMLAVASQRLAEAKEGGMLRLIHADFMNLESNSSEAWEFSYDVAVAALVLEHISDLTRLFSNVSRVLRPGGCLYVSEIHYDRSSQGTLAHFIDAASGSEVWLDSHAHSPDSVSSAAHSAGLRLKTCAEVFGSQDLADQNPKWVRHLGKPMLHIYTFEK
jgi:malonyl-CoA O-methyltransferase